MVARDEKWRCTSLRSSFGAQCKSNLSSSPSCGFGSSIRESSRNQYVSPEADRAKCKAQGGNNSMGAIYKVQESVGKQSLSTMPSAPQASFGTSKRPSMAEKTDAPGPGAYKVKSSVGDQFVSTLESPAKTRFGTSTRDQAEKVFMSPDHEKSFYGKESPGPSAYNVSGGLGKQTLSDRPSLPAWKVGAEKRFNYDFVRTAESIPGAGQYNIPSALGHQVTSSKKSLPTVKFGSSTRDASGKIFISPDHEKHLYGSCSPGPTTANQADVLGKQVVSSVKTAPKWGFGRGKRQPEHMDDTPGPGEYYA